MERLQKYIASCGIASRRKAEELITEGKVQVNGRKVTELGVKINPQKDKVKVNGQLLAQEKPVYYLLNKPKGVITSVSDPQGRETVLDYIKNETKRIDDHNGVHEVEITIHEGRNRQVRRMFEHFGYRIHNLKRIAYAGLTLGGVKRGASRQLTIREVKALKALGTDKA